MSVVPVPSLHPPALRPVRDPAGGAETPSPDVPPPGTPSAETQSSGTPSAATPTAGTASVETASAETASVETASPQEQPAGIEVIHVVGWPDPVIDRLGYDPRSLYVETFWLGILGPTCTWLLRRLAAGLDDDPDGFDLALADTARALGLGDRLGRQSPFRRALARCVGFAMAQQQGPTTLAVRRRIPPLPRRHLDRLPASLQESHARWLVPTRSSPLLEETRNTARRLALALLSSGKDRPEVELQLVRWQVHPAIAHEATQWSWAYRTHDASGRSGARGTSGGGGGGDRAHGTGAGRGI
jgi:hypothetical protein